MKKDKPWKPEKKAKKLTDEELQRCLNKEVVIIASMQRYKFFWLGELLEIGRYNIILNPYALIPRNSLIDIGETKEIKRDFSEPPIFSFLFRGHKGSDKVSFLALAPNQFVAFLYIFEEYHSHYDGGLILVKENKTENERPVIYIKE